MKRFVSAALAALLLIGSIGLLIAQQDPAAPESAAPVFPSELPARYQLIIDRSMFGFFPRESIPGSQYAQQPGPQPGEQHELVSPGTLPGFQHDPGLAAGRDIPAGPAFSLTAVVEVDGAFKAIVVDNASGDGHYVTTGDTVAGYQVATVAQDRVILNNGQDQITLKIDTPKPQSALIPGAAQPKKERLPAPEPDIKSYPPHVQPRIGR